MSAIAEFVRPFYGRRPFKPRLHSSKSFLMFRQNQAFAAQQTFKIIQSQRILPAASEYKEVGRHTQIRRHKGQAVNKGVRTQIQSRAQRIGKGVLPAVQAFGKAVPARIGRFQAAFEGKNSADAVNRSVVKQIAQQFRNNCPPAANRPPSS